MEEKEYAAGASVSDSASKRRWEDLEKANGLDSSPFQQNTGAESDGATAVEEEEQQQANPEPLTPAPANPHGDVPDGGLDAWLQVLGSWVIMVDTWGLVNTFGVYQTYYETELLVGKPGGTSSSISWIGSLQAALLMIGGFASGPLYDAGYFRHLIIVGMLLVIFGQFMTSLATEYWQLVLAQGLTIGLGMGLAFLPSTAILAQYFKRRRALAIGIVSTGSPVAGIVFPILFSRLQPQIGSGWSSRIIAFILLGLSLFPAFFMRTRVPSSAKGTRALFDAGALRELPFVAMMVGAFLGFLVLYVPFFFIQLFAERRGIEVAALSPFYLVTLLNVGSVFGRLVPNALADKFGSSNLIFACVAGSAVMLYGWLGISSQSADAAALGNGSSHLAGVVVFALLYGMFSGGIVSLIASVIIVLSPDMRRVGTRMGMVFSSTGIAVLVGPPIAGAILGDGFSAEHWLGTIGFAAAGLTLAAVGFGVSRVSQYMQTHKLVG